MNLFNYQRRKSDEITIGNTPLGGLNPIRVQSMTNTSTLDTGASVEQCIRIIENGADYVRLTAQGEREALNLSNIKKGLQAQGYCTPLVADIHFNPKAAYAAAGTVDKVRINPGNFADSARAFKQLAYTEAEYAGEIEKIRDRFIPFLDLCRKHHTAIRIGVNHGSLSDRIMSRYGNTPEGMVESCMEFLRICRETGFRNVAVSMKASNTTVMVRSARLLIVAMEREGMAYPLHLGVTEAGDGEDGRIKSAVGIGALLADGVGDTIRVSLSEPPEVEVPVARKLVDYLAARADHEQIMGETAPLFDYCCPQKRAVRTVGNVGGGQVPVVISSGVEPAGEDESRTPDYYFIATDVPVDYQGSVPLIVDFRVWSRDMNGFPCFTVQDTDEFRACDAKMKFLILSFTDLSADILALLKEEPQTVVLLKSNHRNPVGEQKAFFHALMRVGCEVPVVLHASYSEENGEDLQLKAGADLGALLLDYLGEGVWVENQGGIPLSDVNNYQFAILQAARQRTTRTEYISCPSCGRTLFDLQTTISRVKAATSHLKGLKIGIMGCIVNGPGEMADADYGYVGAGRDRISLYKGKTCVEKNIPEDQAVERLVELIQKNGDWHDA